MQSLCALILPCALSHYISFQERAASSTTTGASVDKCKLQWTVLNELNIIFVAVYEGLNQIGYVERLLDLLKSEFCSILPPELKGPGHRNITDVQTRLLSIMRESTAFDKRFLSLLDKCDAMADGINATIILYIPTIISYFNLLGPLLNAPSIEPLIRKYTQKLPTEFFDCLH